MDQEKLDFLKWLDRFERFPTRLRLVVERHSFRSDELAQMRRQIESKWKLKKEFMEKQGS